MNGEKLYEILQDLDEDLIEQADPANKKKTRPAWRRLLPLAAVLMVGVLVWQMTDDFRAETDLAGASQQTESAQDTPVPEAGSATEAARSTEAADHAQGYEEEREFSAQSHETLPVRPVTGDGAGEFYMGYRSPGDISVYDFRPALADTQTLPVYRYPGGMADAYHLNADEAAMREKAEEIARMFGFDPETMERNPTKANIGDKETGVTEEETYTMVYTLMNEDVIISADPALNISLSYRHTGPMTSEEEAESLTRAAEKENGDRLAALLRSRFGWQNPVVVVTESSVNFEGDTHYRMRVYEGGGDPLTDFLQSQMKTATGSFRRDGTIDNLHLDTWEGFEYAGDYPIRTEDEAREDLIAGRHLSAGSAFPGEEYIARTELVYRTNHTDIRMPYYVFYTRMPDERFIDLRTSTEDAERYQEDVDVYRTYVVPAVRAEYLEELPARTMQNNQ